MLPYLMLFLSLLNQCVSIGVIATQGCILAPVFQKKTKNFLRKVNIRHLGSINKNRMSIHFVFCR
nr:MAG TPA: hypothetical protein [Caudoviricetes sp.]